MNITETLIGKNMKSHPDALGLYIGLDEMYIAQSTRKTDGGLVLESLLRVPITDVDRTKLKPLDLNEGFFAEDGWLEALTKVASRKKWKNTQVVVSLSSAFSLVRHFVIPTVLERKHWASAIPLQARKYIHFPFDKMVYAYHVYGFETPTTKQKRLGVIFTMTTKTIIDRIEKGLKTVGLDLVAIEAGALSLSRAFCENDKEAVNEAGRIYSFFGNETASFVFTNQHAPVLLREVEVAGASPAERRRFEITNCTEFIAKQLERDPFEEAVIMGVDSDMWMPLLETDSKKPVRKWDLREVYGIETKSPAEIAAIGASTKFYTNKTPDLDFIKRNRLSDYEFNAGLTFWKLVGVFAVILLLLIGRKWLAIHADKQRLKFQKKKQAKVLTDFEGLSAQQIQTNLDRVKTQNTNLSALMTPTSMTPLLMDIVAAVPDQVWIKQLQYKEDFPPKRGNPRSLSLEGSIQTGNSERDLVVGKQFQEKLLQMPSIKAICGNKAEIKYKDLALLGEGETGKSKDSRNRETSFSFACDSGGKTK